MGDKIFAREYTWQPAKILKIKDNGNYVVELAEVNLELEISSEKIRFPPVEKKAPKFHINDKIEY